MTETEQSTLTPAQQAFTELLAPIGGTRFESPLIKLCFAAGVALRTVGRVAAVGVGCTFCVIQGLAYHGYIEVNWRALEKDYLKMLDKDGDGQVGAGDLAHVWQKTVDCLAFNLPAGMGFTAGLAYGLGASASTSWRLSLAAGIAPRLLAGRMLLGLGGLGATGSPAAATGLYTWWHGPDKARPGYCRRYLLGEAEENCAWPQNDDFGFAKAPWRSRLKKMGECRPQPQIGSAIWDTVPEKEPCIRQGAPRSQLDSKFYPKDPISSRPLKCPIPPPIRVEHKEGIKKIESIPLKQRAIHDTSKRCFPWARSQATGYENPVQWEEEPVPGKRPSHPVSANGPVGVEHRRCFPEKLLPSGIPPPALCKPPFGSEWGGWAMNGAPGRGPLQQPWDSLKGPNEEGLTPI
eukprot:symbB.v1.2.004312.t1/scaffold188.1/size279614/1